MKDVLARIEPKPKKVIDLSPELTEQDYNSRSCGNTVFAKSFK